MSATQRLIPLPLIRTQAWARSFDSAADLTLADGLLFPDAVFIVENN
jgi:hypothetical protein